MIGMAVNRTFFCDVADFSPLSDFSKEPRMSSHTRAKTTLCLSLIAGTITCANAALAAPEDKNQFAVPLKPVSANQQQLNADTAKAINKVPGVHLQGQDLQAPAQDAPITGFHPIKRAIAPIVQLEKNSVQLQQQIMKLDGPISALQPAMNKLHGKLDKVDSRLGEMDGHIVTVDQHVTAVDQQMSGVRSDLSKMRGDLTQLQSPLHSLLGPLNNVARPLEEVRTQLADMRTMLAGVLFAIVASSIGIAIGTPLMAILIFKYRHKLFPNTADRDFPSVPQSDRPVAHHPLEK